MAGLLCMSFVNVYQCVCVSFSFGFRGWMRNLIVLVPDCCLCFYLEGTESCLSTSRAADSLA